MGIFAFIAVAVGLGLVQRNRARKRARRAQAKARAQFEANAGLDVRAESGGQTIPLAYGATAVSGILAYAQTRSTVTRAMVPATWGALEPGESKFFTYLLAQYVLCAAGGVRVRDLHVDGIAYSDDQVSKVAAHVFHEGTASTHAAEFTPERTAADTFTDLAALTGVYKYDLDDPVFSGIPGITAFIEGRKTRSITKRNLLSRTPVYSANTVRVLLDFLRDSVWGPGFSTDDIDLASFRRVQRIGARVMQGASSTIWSSPYPSELNALYGTSYATWGAYYGAAGLSSSTDSGVPGWHGAVAPPVRRYEFHGTLYDTGEWADTALTILETMPGVRLFRGLNGKYKLGLPDPLATSTAPPVVNDDVMLTPPEVEHPDSESKLNSVVVRFANVALDNAPDTLEWPPPGSALAARLLAEDNGIRLTDTVTVEGINNEFHAAAWAANSVLQSRRPAVRWTMTRSGFLYEPGDIIRLQSEIMGLDLDVVVDRVSSSRTWEAKIEAQVYQPTDYLWHTEVRSDAPGISLPALSVPRVASVTAELVEGQLRHLEASWILPTVQVPAVASFDVEWAEFSSAPAAITTRNWRPLGTFPVTAADWSVRVAVGEKRRWYQFRVKARGVTGIAGLWTLSNVVAVDAGEYGSVFHSGAGAPLSNLGKIGDWYIQFGTGDVFEKTEAAVWTLQGNIKGGDGDNWHSGAGEPANSLGKVGDWYLRTATNEIFQKTGTTEWSPRMKLRPPSWDDGHGAPGGALGEIGDYYLDLDTGDVHKKTEAAVWTLQGNIKGGDGDNWHSGAGEPANSLGKVGDWYLRTATNEIFQKTGTTEWSPRMKLRPPSWDDGHGAPGGALGEIGDYYLDLDTGDVHKKTEAAVWTLQGNIKGGDGDNWHSGAGEPANSLGKVGDWYLRTATNEIFQKTGTTEWSPRMKLRPPSWDDGHGAPGGALGEIGDYYLDLDTGDVHKKTEAAVWTLQGNIKGGDGDNWHSGAGEPANSLGKVGDWYIDGATGDLYQKTGTASWTLRVTLRPPTIRVAISGYRVLVTAPEEAALATVTTLTGALLRRANNATQGDNLIGDVVFFYRSGFARSFAWEGSTWRVMDRYIAAELIQAASLTALNVTVRNIDIGETLTAEHVDANLRNARVLWRGSGQVDDETHRYGFTMGADMRDYDVLSGTALVLPNRIYAPFSIPTDPLVSGTINALPSGWSRFACIGGAPGYDTAIFYVWRSADGRSLFMQPHESDENAIFTVIIGFKNPLDAPASGFQSVGRALVLTTRVETVHRRASSTPAAPGGGAVAVLGTIPNGWQRTEPVPTSTQNVYRARRTVTLRNGVFRSSTAWGSVTKLTDKTGTPAVTTRRVETIYKRASLVLRAPMGGATAALGTIPSGWQRDEPTPAVGQNIYRATRTVTLRNGVWYSSTAWGGFTMLKKAAGVAPSEPRNVRRFRQGGVDYWTWSLPLVGTPRVYSDYGFGSVDDKGAFVRWHGWGSTSSKTVRATGPVFRVRATNGYGKSNWVVKGDGVTSRVEMIYRRATAILSPPTRGFLLALGRIPSGWQRTEPAPTSTQNVYRARRTVWLLNGSLILATSWDLTKVADETGSA